MERKIEVIIGGETDKYGLCSANIKLKADCYTSDLLSTILALIFRYGEMTNTPPKEILKLLKLTVKNCAHKTEEL